jgi:hypothetical protein
MDMRGDLGLIAGSIEALVALDLVERDVFPIKWGFGKSEIEIGFDPSGQVLGR